MWRSRALDCHCRSMTHNRQPPGCVRMTRIIPLKITGTGLKNTFTKPVYSTCATLSSLLGQVPTHLNCRGPVLDGTSWPLPPFKFAKIGWQNLRDRFEWDCAKSSQATRFLRCTQYQ